MVRSALMFVVALAAVTLLVSPDSNWVPAPVAAPVTDTDVAEVTEPVIEDLTAPSFIAQRYLDAGATPGACVTSAP